MYFRCGRVRCEHRVDALEEATRCDDATLAGAVSVTHDAGQAVTEDRKHVEASAARRSEASTAVAASAYHRGLVCDKVTSCAPRVAPSRSNRHPVYRRVRGREGCRKRRDTPHARDRDPAIRRHRANLSYAVTISPPFQVRCDAE